MEALRFWKPVPNGLAGSSPADPTNFSSTPPKARNGSKQSARSYEHSRTRCSLNGM